MDDFVYQCKNLSTKVRNEVPFPEPVAAILQKLWQVERAQQRAQKTSVDIQTVL